MCESEKYFTICPLLQLVGEGDNGRRTACFREWLFLKDGRYLIACGLQSEGFFNELFYSLLDLNCDGYPLFAVRKLDADIGNGPARSQSRSYAIFFRAMISDTSSFSW